jgi:hypothetical protein
MYTHARTLGFLESSVSYNVSTLCIVLLFVGVLRNLYTHMLLSH